MFTYTVRYRLFVLERLVVRLLLYIRCTDMMQLGTLQWPGLWNLPVCVVDYETNKIYDKDHPLPPQKSYLDSVSNRCVRLSAVLDLFSEEMREEAEWRLRQLQSSYDIGKTIHSTTTTPKPETDAGEMERKVTTYIPSVALMAFAVIWPYCQSFQDMQNAVLDHLNNYAESVCIDCGFVQRDCKCAADAERRHSSSQMTYLGNAVSVKDCGVQTEPMVVVGMQQKLNTPGISVLVPQNYHLSPDVRMPLTLGQQNAWAVPSTALNASSVNINPLAPNIINLPPTLTFPAGYPPSFVNASSLSTSTTTQSCVSVLRTPLLGGTNVPNSSSIVIQAPGLSTSDAGRKRKLDSDAGDANVADAAVQTTGKSYVKKMKLRLGSFSASDFKIVGRESDSPLNKNQTSSSAQRVAAESGTATGAQAKLGDTVAANTAASFVDVKKDGGTSVEKKYTTVWKLLEDSSDDEHAPDKAAPASQDVPASATTEETSASSRAPASNDDAGTSCTDAVLTPKTHQGVNDKSADQSDVVAAHHMLPEGKEDSVLHQNDHTMEEEDDDKLVIDSHIDDDNQRSECESKSTVSQQNDWEFRNGMKESESADDEKEVSKSANDGEQLEADDEKEVNKSANDGEQLEADDEKEVSKSGNDGEQLEAISKTTKIVDGGSEPSAADADADKSLSVGGASDVSRLPDSSPSKPTADAEGSAVTSAQVLPDVAGTVKDEPTTKPNKVYGKFEYTPTGEHILRCLVPKCSQTFDRKLAADVHNYVHPGFVPGSEGNESPTYLQCHRCEFQAPFYHWYDLLRHMRHKHSIYLVDGTTEHTCEYCGFGFETKELLVSHIDFHYSNRYKCIYCGLLLLTWGQVQRHLENCPEKSKHHRTGGVNLGCPFCTFVFHKRNIRNLHLLSHVDKGLACALCDNGVIWSDWKSLRKHYQQKHAKSMLDKISPFGHDLPHRQPPLRCTRSGCDVTFKTFALFSNHMCRAHDLVPYTLIRCVQCERCFRTEKSHEWHVKHMHGEERLCDKCDFVASSKAMLKLHVSQKHQEKQHTCTECDKSFLYFHQLRIHMAHHARRSIYPCRRCDMEFSRHAELRAHLREDHQGSTNDAEQDEKKSGHTCPECDFHAPTRSAVIRHVRRVHPEVADGTTETEDDDPDHSYFNSKLDLPPQPATPPPLPPRRPAASQFTRSLMSRRGRHKTVTTPADNYYSRADRYVTIVDRRERRNQLRMEKEVEDRVKQLRRWTCARSRSIDEHRTMGRGDVLTSRQIYHSDAADDSTEVSAVAVDVMTSSPARDAYPYLDHSYFCQEPGRAGHPGSVAADVSAFQECETMLLGLPPSGRGKGRRGRPRGRGGWTIASRQSGVVADTGEDMDPIDPAIRDLDLLAESELLLRPAGNYSILQDILGPHCISTSHPTPVTASLRQATSPMKLPGPVPSRMTREPARSGMASDGGLNDSLSLDESSAAGPSDLDDIELCEDDYRLFDPQGGGAASVSHPNTTSSAADDTSATRSWKNGVESGNDNARQYEAGITQQPNRDTDGHTSLSAEEFDDETRSATSEPACTSFETETDHASVPHDDDDDVDVDTEGGDGQQNND